jgi:hypothetical protein
VIRQLRCYVLVCDGCGRTYGEQGEQQYVPHEVSVEEARAGVEQVGWTRDGERDLCPECSPVPYLPVGDTGRVCLWGAP